MAGKIFHHLARGGELSILCRDHRGRQAQRRGGGKARIRRRDVRADECEHRSSLQGTPGRMLHNHPQDRDPSQFDGVSTIITGGSHEFVSDDADHSGRLGLSSFFPRAAFRLTERPGSS